MKTRKMNRSSLEKVDHAKKRWRDAKVGPFLIVLLNVLFVLVPLYIVIITSLTSSVEANNAAFSWWPKDGLTLDAYEKALTRKMAGVDLFRSFINTVVFYMPSNAIGVLISAMAAFAYAKTNFVLKKPMFAILMASMTMPNTVGLMASFLLYDKIGWVNTPLPIVLPIMLGSIGQVFFLKQFFEGIPNELMEAARIDGLGNFGIFVKIFLPISVPALLSQFILGFIAGYNDYMGPLLYLMNSKNYTLPIALAFFAEAYVQDWPLRMAGAMIATIPLLIFYLFGQKYILKGVAISSGLKG